MLLKLRTPGCVIVGTLCVVLSVFEPIRFLVWDMVIATVTGAACIALLWFSGLCWRRPFAYEERDDHDYYDEPEEDELQ